MSRTNKLQSLLHNRTHWDDATWFQVERYLIENTSRPGMLILIQLAGCETTAATRYFKTDAAKLLRDRPPRDVLKAWNRYREQR